MLLRLEVDWNGFSVTGVDLEFHENGDGINLVNVRNESLDTWGSEGNARVLEERVGSTITPSGIGGLGLRSLWVSEPSFNTRKRKK